MIGTGAQHVIAHAMMRRQPGLVRARILFDSLDATSRERKLSHTESEALEAAMRKLGML